MNNAEANEGKYLYGIIRSSAPKTFVTRGIGERGDSVFTIHHGDLAAVVSNSPIIEYDGSRRNLMAHTRVLEEVMGEHTLLPIRFGIIAPDASAVERMLTRRAADLREQFAALEGRIELGLKAFWFEEAIFNEIVAANEAIRDLRDFLAKRRPEETYYERIRLGEMIEADMARFREADAAAILSQLEPLVERVHISNTITDRMVVNAAFLLERQREAAFDAAIQALDAQMGKRMMFKYVGPVPPYNFVNLTLGWE